MLLFTVLAAAALFTGVVGQQPKVVIFQVPSIGTCDANALVLSPSGAARDTSGSGNDGSSSGGSSSGGDNIDLINTATQLADYNSARFAAEGDTLNGIYTLNDMTPDIRQPMTFRANS